MNENLLYIKNDDVYDIDREMEYYMKFIEEEISWLTVEEGKNEPVTHRDVVITLANLHDKMCEIRKQLQEIPAK